MYGALLAGAVAAVLLHGGHPADAGAVFHWWYLAASVVIVGGVSGLLYWYFERNRAATE